ncbi:MAG TPA: CDP-alcohol phosphatidyltransferase family protein [Jatrophihabitans sp.]|nr:CDP-alcohol phosphatidyltransferase family protein [Jatrophihabitans sp.]
MRTVAAEPAVAGGGGAALFAALAGAAGLGPIGAGVGSACLLGTVALLSRGLARTGRTRPSPADRITLVRAGLAAGVAALVVDSFLRPVSLAALVGLAAAALVLDAVDGRVARRRGVCSELGARFDMEVDAFLILALSCFAAPRFGGWVLAIGLARYGYAAGGRLLPWLREPVPVRHWNKVVAAVQGIVLTVAASGLLPTHLAGLALAGALALLAESFGWQVGWLARRHAATRLRPAHG